MYWFGVAVLNQLLLLHVTILVYCFHHFWTHFYVFPHWFWIVHYWCTQNLCSMHWLPWVHPSSHSEKPNSGPKQCLNAQVYSASSMMGAVLMDYNWIPGEFLLIHRTCHGYFVRKVLQTLGCQGNKNQHIFLWKKNFASLLKIYVRLTFCIYSVIYTQFDEYILWLC